MTLAHISINRPLAEQLAVKSDRTTAHDPSYVIKTTIGEIFGPTGLRPWRALAQRYKTMEVVGFLDAALKRQLEPGKRSELIADHELTEISIANGDEIEFIAQFAAQKCLRSGATRRRVFAEPGYRTEGGNIITPTEAEKQAAYLNWFNAKLNVSDSGIVIDGDNLDLSQEAHSAIRKGHQGAAFQRMAITTATFRGRIVNPAIASAFLRQGIGKFKDIGFGAILPASTVTA